MLPEVQFYPLFIYAILYENEVSIMSKASNPKVSIIIPVFNSETYLKDTLKSVSAQTYGNLEVLLVDDGSTDKSGQICDEYAEKNHDFRVFHIHNGGVAKARNFALEQITGNYVTFIDSDDLVKPEFVETMVQVALKCNTEIVTSKFFDGRYKTPEEFETYACSTIPETVHLTFLEYSPNGRYAHNTVWRGLYAADLARLFQFTSGLRVGEDTLFFYQMLKQADSLVFVDEYFYYYRYRDDSLAHTRTNKEFPGEVTAWERVCELFSDKPDRVQNDFRTALAFRCRKNYINALLRNDINPEINRELLGKARSLWGDVLQCTNISLKKKAKYLLFITNPYIYGIYVRKRVLK